jgi:hypothetical protein
MRKTALIWISLLGAALLLCGCTPWISLEQPQQTDSILLQPGNSLGQTFTAYEDGLQGLAIYLVPLESGQGTLHLQLTANPPGSSEPISATIPLSKVTKPGWYRFNFQPLEASSGQDYTASFSLSGSGKLSLATGPADSYLDGSLYQDGQPVDAQASFRLAFDPRLAAGGLAQESLTWLLYSLAVLWLFILPGWGLLSFLYRGWSEKFWIEKIALAAGLSLALYPLLFLWTAVLGLKLGTTYAWLPGLVGVAFILFRQVQLYRSGKFSLRWRWKRENLLPDILLLFLLAALVFSRLWVIRELEFPLWGDSYQHTMIAQLFVDNQGLFNSWLPYAPLSTFTYHFGFHTLVAVLHWLTALPLPASTLWTGQIVNILAILTLVPLAVCLGRSRWAAVVALLVAGLLSPMPQAYLNWGRYTQLAGQAILPVAVVLSIEYLEDRLTDKRLLAVLALALGGLALTHYRIFIFAVLFYIAYFLFKARRNSAGSLVLKIAWITLGAVLLSLPWLVHIFSGGIPNIALAQLNTPVNQLSDFATQYNSIGSIGAYLSPLLWTILLISVGWGLWRREIDATIIASWWLLVLLAANPQWLKLPGSGILSNFAVVIAAYIPVGILIGAAAGWLAGLAPRETQPPRRYHLLIQITLALLVLFCTVFGLQARLKDVKPQGAALITRSDQRAARWIDSNLPEQARFLVNAFFAYNDWVIVGSDGGWWLPLTARRQTSLPPINYGNEQSSQPDYRQQVNNLQSEIIAKGIDHSDVLRMLKERGIRYIYIGQRQGRVNNPNHTLDPQVLLASPAFKLLYHQDRVYIFEVLP